MSDKNRDKAEAIMIFVNRMIGAYEAGFIDRSYASLSEIYTAASDHCKDNYGLVPAELAEIWGEDLVKEINGSGPNTEKKH